MLESGAIGGTDISCSVSAELGSAKLESGTVGGALSSIHAKLGSAKSDSAMIDPYTESAKMESSCPSEEQELLLLLYKCVRPSEHQNKILDPPPAPLGHKIWRGKFTMLIINYNMKGITRKDI
jgi:hypothetical protein